MLGIHDCAAFERRYYAFQFDPLCCRVDGDFGARGDVAALFKTAGDAEAVVRFWLGLAPSELFGSGLQHSMHARVFQISVAEFERVDFRGACHVVHMRFAGEVVCRGGESAVGALA